MIIALALAAAVAGSPPIDRHALVSRHDVVLTSFDGNSPLQVGNGEFAFGLDITGLQSFAPFNTMSHWGWNSLPVPSGHSISEYQEQIWDTHGRPVPYPMPDPKHPEISDWLAGNPHRINLGRLGFSFKKVDGTVASVKDIQHPRQVLDLWNGTVTSRFALDGQPVVVTTACHPKLDEVAVHVDSPLVNTGRLAVLFDCPEDNGRQFDNFVGDAVHSATPSMKARVGDQWAVIRRDLGPNSYSVRLQWQGKATLQRPGAAMPAVTILKAMYGAEGNWLDVTDVVSRRLRAGDLDIRADNSLAGDPDLGKPKKLRVDYSIGGIHSFVETPENGDLVTDLAPDRHRFTLQPVSGGESFSFVCGFSPHDGSTPLPSAQATSSASRERWPEFWRSGGAIDLSGSSDPRWGELERRIVLSQYLMAVNEAGDWPPQESGLVNNGWFGRFHLEMYWWHAAHWALWNRWRELDRSLGFYEKLLPTARKRAAEEGFEGARWPKCIAPDDREWPHVIHSLLIWQQPHPIFFAELDYRAHPNRATLKRWQPVVEATADFLASYAYLDPAKKQYVLGPPLVVVSENTDPKVTQNPAFELGYWRFGLLTAQEWRTRLGLPRRKDWDRVLHRLSPIPEQDGKYVLYEGVKEMWTKWNFEHPALTGIFGMLPGYGVDKATMARTLDQVHATWDLNHTWGWDFPMLAMCAARLGEPNRALDYLMNKSPNFQFDSRGLATGGPFPYFPSNGALLYAVALMAAGWDGAPKLPAPGFPRDGRWKVRWEGLSRAP